MYFCAMSIQSIAILFLYGFVFSWLTVPRIGQIVRKYKILRKPSERDLHWRLIPKLTGLSFYIAFLILSFAFVPYVDVQRLSLFLVGGALISYVGIRDDIFELNPFVKLGLQLLAIGLFIIVDDLVVRDLYGFLGVYGLPFGFDYALTFFIGVFMINSFNLCDGVDGLAAMMGIVMFVGYGIIFYVIGDALFLSFSMILIGGLFAFLRYNLPQKNKVFMGDTGSLFLGFVFYLFTMYIVTSDSAILTVMLPEKYLIILAVLVLYTVPILDSGSVFFSRLWRKKSPFSPDNSHIHHLVLAFTKSHALSSIIISGNLSVIVIIFSELAFTVEPNTLVYIYFSGLFLGYIILFYTRRILRDRGVNC
jgi:UDP-N-acetylmuramyl pentapeptide phosphotransferase/UDP-N-acetylglucosamine-1-phosphate transferase